MTEDNNKEYVLDFKEIIKVLFKYKKTLILTTMFFSVVSIIFSLVVDEKYMIRCKIDPAAPTDENMISPVSTFSSFNLTGVNETPIGKSIRLNLESNSFRKKIVDKYLNDERVFDDALTDLESEYKDKPQKEKDIAKYNTALEVLSKIFTVSVNRSDNTIELSIVLKDKYFAAEFLNDILMMLRNHIVNLNTTILESDIEHYSQVLDKIDNPTVKNEVSTIINNKLSKGFTLTSNTFIVIDEPMVPLKRIFPKRQLIVIISTIVGFIMSMCFVFVHYYYSIYRRNRNA